MVTASTKVRVNDEILFAEPGLFPQQARGPRLLKRLFDLAVAGPALLLLAPLFAVLAWWIKRDSRGPVFFRQTRIGQGGIPFQIYKFRTMYVAPAGAGAQITIGQDRRITPSGHWLRRYKLDELPQFINVLKGEMSIVGPRPEVPRYVACYGEQQRAILALKPGITSPASLAFRSESELLAEQDAPEQFYVTAVLPAKIQADLVYAQRATWLKDLGLVVQTARLMFE